MLPQEYLVGDRLGHQPAFRSYIMREKTTHTNNIARYKIGRKSSSTPVGTMSLRCLLVLGLVAAAQAALIHKRDIPVEVVYEDDKPTNIGVRNLAEKVQLSPSQLKEEIISGNEVEVPSGNPNGVKNLDEMNQLSAEEQNEALKHLPGVQSEIFAVKSVGVLEEVETPANAANLLNQAEEVISSGLNAIRKDVEKTSESLPKPSEAAWAKLNKTLDKLLRDEYEKVQLSRQEGTTAAPVQNQNNQIIQNLVTGFQNLTNNFISNFQQNNRGNGTEDEQQGQQPGFFQNFVSQFSGGVQQVVNNINNLGGQSTPPTVQGDTGTGSTQPPNFINNVISSVQQFFSGNGNQGNPLQNINLNQSDSGVQPTTNSPNIIQGAIQQISQVVNNIRPQAASTQNTVLGDEGVVSSTTQRGPIGIIQNFGTQIGSQIGNIFGQSTKPPGSEDEAGGSTQPTNIIQSLGQAIQNANPFRPQGSTASPGSNIISQGTQVVNNQLQQFVGAQNGTNPVESIQNAISNVVPSTEAAKIDAETVTTANKKEKSEIMETVE